MAAERRKYTRDYKEAAVAEREDQTIGQGAGDKREYAGVAAVGTAREPEIKAFPGNGNPRDEELVQLRKRVPHWTKGCIPRPLGRLKLGVRGICFPAYEKISMRNLRYPAACGGVVQGKTERGGNEYQAKYEPDQKRSFCGNCSGLRLCGNLFQNPQSRT
jgi:hypothetical protein